MGLQLSVLVACVGALEILACLKHVIVCVLKLTDSSTCHIDYFHQTRTHDNSIIIYKSNVEDDGSQMHGEIEAILRENISEPNILCIGAPPVTDPYVRIPTPIPFGVDDEIADQRSSSNESSLVDSGNENPTTTHKSVENLSASTKGYNGSSSDVSSLEDIENHIRTNSKKNIKRSKTPELHRNRYDNYDDEEEDSLDHQNKYHKDIKTGFLDRRLVQSKTNNAMLGRSTESLSCTRTSKRHREPKRCKSEIQLQSAKNLLRDEWTNTSPVESNINLSTTSSKPNISVLIQTSFDDNTSLVEDSSYNKFENGTEPKHCPNCNYPGIFKKSTVKQVTETGSVNGDPKLIKISSFEEASDDDYKKIKKSIANGNSVANMNSKETDNESYDEYIDADDNGLNLQPIQYTIPDPDDKNKAYWVNRRYYTKTYPISSWHIILSEPSTSYA